ncbi:hypothetical protein STCU_07554 [Strigomonas culicis]|nr:hypothetical protein STCU_07554 [Strigomonas culicis]|eukprot:EPY23686.1 hypothetical protein STCU_07554 [Strigomonas culicis]
MQLHAGYLLDTPVFKMYFHDEDGDVAQDQHKSARKALAQLARKCTVLAKADLSGAAADGALGLDEFQRLKESFSRLLTEAKVGAVDTQALPAPQAHRRGDAATKKRGGVKAFKRREAMKEPVSVVQRALSHVRMGVSEEEQRRALLERRDIQVELMKETERDVARERKQRNERPVDEYDDLMNLAL